MFVEVCGRVAVVLLIGSGGRVLFLYATMVHFVPFKLIFGYLLEPVFRAEILPIMSRKSPWRLHVLIYLLRNSLIRTLRSRHLPKTTKVITIYIVPKATAPIWKLVQ